MYPGPNGGLVTCQREVTERQRSEEELRGAYDVLELTRPR
jgi:hypothetical protein